MFRTVILTIVQNLLALSTEDTSVPEKKKGSVIHSAFSVGCDLPCAPHSPGQ